MRDKHIIILY